MSTRTTEQPEQSFLLYDYDYTPVGDRVASLASEDQLPFDTLFRLASIGFNQPDLAANDGRTLQWGMITDMLSHHQEPSRMRPDTRKLLFGDRPSAVLDWYPRINASFYHNLDPMYYRISDLADVIQERRVRQGKTISEVPSNWWRSPKEQERANCIGLARPVWRVLVQRTKPEWLKEPNTYCPPTISFGNVYYASENTMRRRIVGAAVVSDSVVMELYEEAQTTGVRGIGPAGRESLRTMLAEEHPELY